MCRRNIPTEFLEHPQLVNGADDINMTKATDDGYQWFYEGRNGWWQYDDRTSQDIEDAYKKGEKSCTILVAGYVYIVDLEAMLQQRQNEPTRCRRVKRDLATIPKKGVAGLRIEGGNIVTAETSSNSGGGSNSHHVLTHMHHMMMPLDYIDDDVGTDANGRSSDIQNISTIAATDAAIRIASDIIGSTLAHADELIRRRNSMPTLASDIVAANSSSGGSSSHMDGGGLYDNVPSHQRTHPQHYQHDAYTHQRTPYHRHHQPNNHSQSHQRQQQRQQHRAQRRQQQQQLLFSSMRGICKEFFVNIFEFYKALFYSTTSTTVATTSSPTATVSSTAQGLPTAINHGASNISSHQ